MSGSEENERNLFGKMEARDLSRLDEEGFRSMLPRDCHPHTHYRVTKDTSSDEEAHKKNETKKINTWL